MKNELVVIRADHYVVMVQGLDTLYECRGVFTDPSNAQKCFEVIKKQTPAVFVAKITGSGAK